MLKIILNYAASVVAFLLAFYAFNLGMDRVNFNTGLNPVYMFPVAAILCVLGVHFHGVGDDLTQDKNEQWDE